MNFKEQCQEKTAYVESILQKFLPQEEGYQKTVIEAMNYSLTAGGKRLRPLLMLEVYRLYGGSGDEIESFMAALEMIHTYSLVHDDLPAMDNDEYRRGRKTTHIVYGEAMGILAGDGLLNYAFETAAGAFADTADPARLGKALQILSKKAGIYGMIGGQCVDIESEGLSFGQERLDVIYQLKTSALLEAAFMIGAVLAGAPEDQIVLVEEIAKDVGLAFQIQDDILDVTSTTEQLGKPVHSDEKNQKVTYVTLIGIEKAKEAVEQISGRAIEKLASIKGDTEFLSQLLQSLINRQK
ncbi:MAG: polyprenyl synthetase family protein [Lachnospiraceae bacterium]|nr:polyprenyl synthetase family protein [Lachnospiraceae bacterium]